MLNNLKKKKKYIKIYIKIYNLFFKIDKESNIIFIFNNIIIINTYFNNIYGK